MYIYIYTHTPKFHQEPSATPDPHGAGLPLQILCGIHFLLLVIIVFCVLTLVWKALDAKFGTCSAQCHHSTVFVLVARQLETKEKRRVCGFDPNISETILL